MSSIDSAPPAAQDLPDDGATPLPDAKLTRVFAIGIALWLGGTAVSAVALLLSAEWAGDAIRISAAGAALGLLGYWWALRRKR